MRCMAHQNKVCGFTRFLEGLEQSICRCTVHFFGFEKNDNATAVFKGLVAESTLKLPNLINANLTLKSTIFGYAPLQDV